MHFWCFIFKAISIQTPANIISQINYYWRHECQKTREMQTLKKNVCHLLQFGFSHLIFSSLALLINLTIINFITLWLHTHTIVHFIQLAFQHLYWLVLFSYFLKETCRSLCSEIRTRKTFVSSKGELYNLFSAQKTGSRHR